MINFLPISASRSHKSVAYQKKYGTPLPPDVDNTLWRFRMFGRFATTLCGFRITLDGLRIRYAVLELRCMVSDLCNAVF